MFGFLGEHGACWGGFVCASLRANTRPSGGAAAGGTLSPSQVLRDPRPTLACAHSLQQLRPALLGAGCGAFPGGSPDTLGLEQSPRERSWLSANKPLDRPGLLCLAPAASLSPLGRQCAAGGVCRGNSADGEHLLALSLGTAARLAPFWQPVSHPSLCISSSPRLQAPAWSACHPQLLLQLMVTQPGNSAHVGWESFIGVSHNH